MQFYHELYIYFLFVAIKRWLASAMWLKSIFRTAYALFAGMVCLSKYRNLHNTFAIYLLSPFCAYFQILLSKTYYFMAKMPFKNCHFNALRQNVLKNFRVKMALLFGLFFLFCRNFSWKYIFFCLVFIYLFHMKHFYFFLCFT